MNIINTYHPKLLNYKNKHNNETCYIFGSGPSFNLFKEQEVGVYIGCNNIIKNEIKNKLNYYFFGHGYMEHTKNSVPIYGNHKQDIDNLLFEIEKFAAVSRDNSLVHGFTYDEIKKLENINAIPFDINLKNINKNLESSSFLNHSIVFPAIQFALYCGFTQIYLVGCDCDGYYHSNSYNQVGKSQIDKNIVNWWKNIYEFKQLNYPNTQIISINPVGLKNIMDKDIIT